jgi:hypothetical protein
MRLGGFTSQLAVQPRMMAAGTTTQHAHDSENLLLELAS